MGSNHAVVFVESNMSIIEIEKIVYTVEVFGGAFQFDATEPNNMLGLQYLIQNGLSQSLRDAGALAKGATEAEKLAAAQTRWEKILSGTVSVRGVRKTSLQTMIDKIALLVAKQKHPTASKEQLAEFAEQYAELDAIQTLAETKLVEEEKRQAELTALVGGISLD